MRHFRKTQTMTPPSSKSHMIEMWESYLDDGDGEKRKSVFSFLYWNEFVSDTDFYLCL